jgi:multiple sugar transport system permease protein
MRRSSRLRILLRYLLAYGMVALLAFPLYAVILTSFQHEIEIRTRNVRLLPRQVTLDHYREVLKPGHIVPIKVATVNSLIVSGLTGLTVVSLGSLAAYALARFQVRAEPWILYGLTSVYTAPTVLFVIPLFVLATRLGVTDTYLVLVVLYSAFTLPFTIWVLKGFFERIPRELDEAARLDGCSILQALVRVVLPLAAPGLVAAFIFVFVLAWIEFLTPLLFARELRILTVALGLYRGTADILLGQQAAAAMLATVPVALLLIIFQRQIVEILTSGVEH